MGKHISPSKLPVRAKKARQTDREQARLKGKAAILEALETRRLLSADVLTWHDDSSLQGAQNSETTLTPSNVNATNFGKLFSYSVDGYTYAEPLYKTNLTINGKVHNVVFAATENDSVYAFDASNPDPSTGGGLLWKDTFVNPSAGVTAVPQADVISADIVPTVGITGTPVIDASTNTMYLVTKSKEMVNGTAHYIQRLHALDILTGADKTTPFVIGDTINNGDGTYTNNTTISAAGTGDGSVNGVVTFNALREHQRSALELHGNTVYVVWASHGDNGPYHGWLVGFDKTTLQPVGSFCTSPDGGLSGIWQSGAGPAIDASGNIYFATGNGTFDAIPGGPNSIGQIGGALGYQGINKSASVLFRSYPGSTTGLAFNGGTTSETSLSGTGIDFAAGSTDTTIHTYQATLTYSQSTKVLTETIKDLNTNATTTQTYNNVDLQSQVGSTTAYVGFTGGTGFHDSKQSVLSWTYNNGSTTTINHSAGFTSNSDLQNNGYATFTGGAAQITDGQPGYQNNGEAGTVFSKSQVDITNFSTTFTFQMAQGTQSPVADGITFTIQNNPTGRDYGESVVRLNPTAVNGQYQVADSFTPYNFASLNNGDTDLGSGGTLILPDFVGSAAHPHLMVEVGKQGAIYLIDRDNMGKITDPGSGPDNVVQTATLGGPGLWGSPAFLQTGPNSGLLYYQAANDVMKAFAISNGVITSTPISMSTTVAGYPGAQPSLSSNNGANAIAWMLEIGNYGSKGHAVLHAYDANNLGTELYNSNQVGTRDQVGGSVKFTVPTIADGHVYAGTEDELDVYGLFPSNSAVPAAPTNVAGTAPSSTEIDLTWTPPASGTATEQKIERSTDGGNTFQQIAIVGGSVSSYADTGLKAGTQYVYKIVATNQVGDSPDSSTATVSTHIAPPILSISNIGSSEIDIAWVGTVDNRFEVYRSTDGMSYSLVATDAPNVTSYADTNVSQGPTYYYKVIGYNNNPADVVTSNIVRASIGPTIIDHSGGFGDTSDLVANGNAAFAEGVGRLTDGGGGEAGTIFSTSKVGLQKFDTTFQTRVHEGSDPRADGYTFILQANSPNAVGQTGGGLGYAGIPNSVAIKFDIYSNNGEGNDSTGLFINGDYPSTPVNSIESTKDITSSGINLYDQHTHEIHLTYDGTSLSETITDLFVTNPDGTHPTYSTTYQIDLAKIIGNETAYVGFGGGTGGLTSIQDVLNWRFESDEIVPTAPSNLTVTSSSVNTVSLKWKINSYSQQGFYVERSTDGQNFTQIAVLGPNASTYTDTNAPSGTTVYRVRAFNANGPSAYSNTVAAITGGNFTSIDYSGGFTDTSNLTFNGGATTSSGALQLTDGGTGEGRSVFTNTRFGVEKFTTSFTIQQAPGTNPPADGMAFVIQGVGPTALGPTGGGLGYGPDNPSGPPGIGHSIAIKFDLYSNNGEGSDSTGLFVDGHSPTTANSSGDTLVRLDNTGITLGNGDPIKVDLSYDTDDVLHETLTDTVTGQTFTTTYNVNIAALIGGNTAYMGFTGGTGGLTAVQTVQSWTGQFLALNATHLAVTGVPSYAFTGNPNQVTITPLDALNNTVSGSTDTIHFSSSDAAAGLPADYTFTSADAGSHTFTVTFNTKGDQTFTIKDLTNGLTNTYNLTLVPGVTIDHSNGFASNSDMQANGVATFPNQTAGIFTGQADIGTAYDPYQVGSATFSNGTYTINGGGSDIWGTQDHFHFAYLPLTGNGEIVARMTGESTSDYWVKGGLMIRGNTSEGAPLGFMLETPDPHNEPIFQWRSAQDQGENDSGNHNGPIDGTPVWLRLVRQGNNVSGYYAVDDPANPDGHDGWIQMGSTQSISLPSTALIGLALTAHNDNNLATATFDHVSVTGTTGSTQTPLQLTDENYGEASSAFTKAKFGAGMFSTSFLYNDNVSGADGFTFTIQNDPNGPTALGGGGGDRGYGGIQNSVAVAINIYQGSSTSLGINGNFQSSIGLGGSGIDFSSGHTFLFNISYDPSKTLTETITDTLTGAVFTNAFSNVDIPTILGSTSSYVGFTGGAGGATSQQEITDWTGTFVTTNVDHLAINAPATSIVGAPASVAVTAQDVLNQTVVDYTGTVHLTSSDPNASLPADYTFVSADNGSHTFTVTLNDAGSQTVTATDSADGLSSTSSPIQVQPAATSLVANGSTATYGDSTVSLTATVLANSPSTAVVNEGTVTFNIVQNGQVVATVTSGTVQHGQVSATLSLAGLHAGSYTIQATYNDPGSSPNFTASQNSSTLTINRAALTVTIANATKIYGAPNPTFTATYSGFVNNEGPSNLGGSLVLSTSATTTSPVGTYAINGSGLTSNDYTITYMPGVLSITYATSVQNDLNKAYTDGSVLAITLQVKDANGNNLTSANLAVTALGISPATASAPTMPPTSPGNSQPGNMFTYVAPNDTYNLRLVDANGNRLAAGSYKFYYTIAGDPIVHYFIFTVK